MHTGQTSIRVTRCAHLLAGWDMRIKLPLSNCSYSVSPASFVSPLQFVCFLFFYYYRCVFLYLGPLIFGYVWIVTVPCCFYYCGSVALKQGCRLSSRAVLLRTVLASLDVHCFSMDVRLDLFVGFLFLWRIVIGILMDLHWICSLLFTIF